MDVKQIDYSDTYPIRSQMLRPGLPIETCHFDGDDNELAFHLGAYIDDTLASVASFYFKSHPGIIEQEHQYQLRGMATLPEYQHQGLSRALLKAAFPIIQNNHVSLVWCNARVGASGFYEKVGFKKISDMFEVPGVGPHYLMVKKIAS
ncbi:MAG: GNAT family N-acetyltransferase [Bacteriovoracaceae bacterium]